jgi:hypothetical protein
VCGVNILILRFYCDLEVRIDADRFVFYVHYQRWGVPRDIWILFPNGWPITNGRVPYDDVPIRWLRSTSLYGARPFVMGQPFGNRIQMLGGTPQH